MSAKSTRIDQIGSELVQASRELDQSSMPASTRLFPYVYIASRRMSLRAMSKWLKDSHDVDLSAAQISRALRQPDLHLSRLAEFIAPMVTYLAVAYQADAWQLLYGETDEHGPSYFEELCSTVDPSQFGDFSDPRWDELQYFGSVWHPIPHEVKQLLEPYLRPHIADLIDSPPDEIY